jgi:alcohol dehydrogenase
MNLNLSLALMSAPAFRSPNTLGGPAIASAARHSSPRPEHARGGHCSRLAQGQALAALRPEFPLYTYQNAVSKFAAVGGILNPDLEKASDRTAAEGCCEEIDIFLKKIGMWISPETLRVSRGELRYIANDGQVLPDYGNNLRVAALRETFELLAASYEGRV